MKIVETNTKFFIHAAQQSRQNTSAITWFFLFGQQHLAFSLTTVGESLGHSHEQQIPTAQSSKNWLNDAQEPPWWIASLVLSMLGLKTTRSSAKFEQQKSERFCRPFTKLFSVNIVSLEETLQIRFACETALDLLRYNELIFVCT
jgi:hypothetical protein